MCLLFRIYIYIYCWLHGWVWCCVRVRFPWCCCVHGTKESKRAIAIRLSFPDNRLDEKWEHIFSNVCVCGWFAGRNKSTPLLTCEASSTQADKFPSINDERWNENGGNAQFSYFNYFALILWLSVLNFNKLRHLLLFLVVLVVWSNAKKKQNIEEKMNHSLIFIHCSVSKIGCLLNVQSYANVRSVCTCKSK